MLIFTIEASFQDVINNIKFWNSDKDLGIVYQGENQLGAAWSVGNCNIYTRQVSSGRTEMKLDQFRLEKYNKEADEAWSEIISLFKKNQFTIHRPPSDVIANELQKTRSPYPPYKELPDEIEWKSQRMGEILEDYPNISVDWGIELVEKDWKLLSDQIKAGKKFKADKKEARKKTHQEAAEEFFEMLEQNRIGEHDRSEKPGWFPKKPKTIVKWKQEYAIFEQLREEYKYQYAEGNTDNPEPNIEDFIEAIANNKGKKYSKRHIRDVIKAGDNGWLD